MGAGVEQRAQLPPPDSKYPAHGRDLLYDQHLAGKPVLDTTQVALRALLQLNGAGDEETAWHHGCGVR